MVAMLHARISQSNSLALGFRLNSNTNLKACSCRVIVCHRPYQQLRRAFSYVDEIHDEDCYGREECWVKPQ